MEINQLYTSSLRLFASTATAATQPQLDAKLFAFCTILTVAVSIMLSFKQSRCLLINATTTYPLCKARKCLKCLRGGFTTKTVKKKQQQVRNENEIVEQLSQEQVDCIGHCSSSSLTYFKLKRLRHIASLASKLTSFHSYFFYRTFKSTLSRMRRGPFRRGANSTAASSSSSNSQSPAATPIARRHFFRHRVKNEKPAPPVDKYCPMCQNSDGLKPAMFPQSMSAPNLTSARVRSLDNLNYAVSVKSFASLNLPDKPQNTSKTYNSKVRLYKKLPLRSMSRAWGEINQIDLPVWCRKPCFQFYSWMFNCNLDEIDEELTDFKNLSEFFRRSLKADARVIDTKSCLVSPCDGKILHFGKVDKGYLEQVKGVNYMLQGFLGVQNWPKVLNGSSLDLASGSLPATPHFTLNDEAADSVDKTGQLSEEQAIYEKNILYNPDNCLYHCVIYLAPGDYHRFHSPTDWTIYYRRHFPGELFSVNPSVARWLQGLFNMNERVVYYGKWKYGFFSMTPVGATNVGSIKVYMDQKLTTNSKSANLSEQDLDKSFCSIDPVSKEVKGVEVSRGANFGEFNLGSTIVLVFEAPKNFDFNVNQNEKVFFGQKLGSAVSSSFL